MHVITEPTLDIGQSLLGIIQKVTCRGVRYHVCEEQNKVDGSPGLERRRISLIVIASRR